MESHRGTGDAKQGADLAEWEEIVESYLRGLGYTDRTLDGLTTERARQALRDRTRSAGVPEVDLWVDPACPYTWLVSRWLAEVGRQREVVLRYHVMSMRILNEGRTLDDRFRAAIEDTVGPSRVAIAILVHHGPEALPAWHTAFGRIVFRDRHRPSRAEYDAAATRALRRVGLPEELAEAAHTTAYDEALRRSHMAGVAPVGVDTGTPVLHLDGAAFFGPVLDAVPTGAEAVRLFDGVRLLGGCRLFHELKQTRTRPPDLTDLEGDMVMDGGR